MIQEADHGADVEKFGLQHGGAVGLGNDSDVHSELRMFFVGLQPGHPCIPSLIVWVTYACKLPS